MGDFEKNNGALGGKAMVPCLREAGLGMSSQVVLSCVKQGSAANSNTVRNELATLSEGVLFYEPRLATVGTLVMCECGQNCHRTLI